MSINGQARGRLSLTPAVLATAFILLGLASPAFAQIFNDVISNVITGGCVGLNPTGNLAARCGAGIPGASGGSTTALTDESSPVPERQIQRLVGPINVYFAGDYERFHKSLTTYEPVYSTDIWRALVGADYGVNDRVSLGGAFRITSDHGDSKPAGNFNTNAYGFLLNGHFAPAPKFFIDGSATYMRYNYGINRAVFFNSGAGNQNIGTARGDPNGNEFETLLNGGYDFNFQSITFGPRVGLNYKYNQVDSYRESGTTGLELAYKDQTQNSFTSLLGLYGSVAISTSIGVLVPQINTEYVHEFLDPQRRTGFTFTGDLNAIQFRFANDPPDRNYFNLGAGVVLQLAHGIAPFINYRALVGYKDETSYRVTFGVRMEF